MMLVIALVLISGGTMPISGWTKAVVQGNVLLMNKAINIQKSCRLKFYMIPFLFVRGDCGHRGWPTVSTEAQLWRHGPLRIIPSVCLMSVDGWCAILPCKQDRRVLWLNILYCLFIVSSPTVSITGCRVYMRTSDRHSMRPDVDPPYQIGHSIVAVYSLPPSVI